ncbi:hypothetical protein DOTSEDRAFT_24113 [Dothistroma septosporum NZE10]|uniref:Uncharacterized protein n=1 Tax=Dothistroma septosporum (strain NZE10 / CBS 128990) TaxID=675120 RepID=N1PNP6_DOTSN|nr:hypothetical protein DOTSEDRAFT_24113 [Dothistroma septosporum NZE10]
MQSITAFPSHEFHHSNEVGGKAPNSVGHIGDITYGPSNCFRLRKVSTESNNQKTFMNADSYKWFAMNAYYDSKCGKTFGDPEITTADSDEGNAEAERSIEYMPEVVSGGFVGVYV